MSPLILLLLLAAPTLAQTRVDSARVERLLARAIIIDLHDDTTQMITDEGYNLGERHDYGQVDIPRMRRGHVAGIFFSIWCDSKKQAGLPGIKRALDEIDADRREVARHPSDIVMATTADEIMAVHRSGKIAALMGIEGGHMIDSDLAVLRTYYQLGARYMTLTHGSNTPWADSSGDKPAHNGLTDFGKDVVREMNRLGMMVDISHVSDKTFYDVIAATSAPVIASHSSCRALCNAPRDITDDMLRAVAKNGGVVHINFFEAFLDDGFRQRYQALSAKLTREGELQKMYADDGRRLGAEQRKINAERIAKLGRIPLSKLLDHFMHAVQVAGVDHVGMGSDFDGSSDQFPQGMEDISKIPNLVRGLMERGLSDEDILKILGGNTLRVMRELEGKKQPH